MNRQYIYTLIALFLMLPIGAISNNAIQLTWPDDFSNPSIYEGKIIELNQKMYITDLYGWDYYGSITLSSARLVSPTELAYPETGEYYTILNKNSQDILTLDDGLNTYRPRPLPWIGQKGYLRNGAYTNHIVGKFTKERYGYTITPTEEPIFENLERPTKPENVGEYDIKVCGFNMQYYLASNFGTGFGPDNETESQMQHNKLMKALIAIDADIYGLVEVQQGQKAIKKLTDALNQAIPGATFAYIKDATLENRTYTKSCFIYRSDKIKPIKELKSNDAEVPHRKKAQCFELIQTGEKFVYIINHFKAKSGKGSGDNADQGDGQGLFNGSRKREATATITFAKSCIDYYGDSDVLIMGDLNAHSKEDPLRILNNAGYENLIKKYGGQNAYTYSFRGAVGCLDHALANKGMEKQITGCTVFHINTDESLIFGYDGEMAKNDMYRSSDHDPVIVGIKLGNNTATNNTKAENQFIIYGENGIIGISNADKSNMSIWSTTGQCLYNTKINSTDYIFDTKSIGLKNGIYIVKLENNEERNNYVQKLIIK